MSHQNDPTRNVPYDPLPLTTEDHPSHALYNAPPSPDPNLASFASSQYNASGSSIPTGAAQPRFMGQAALYDSPGGNRDSYASSQHTYPNQGSEYSSSVYALNDAHAAPLAAYRDDPRDNYFAGEPGSLPMTPVGQSRYLEEKRTTYAAPRAKSRRLVMIAGIVAAIILLLLAVIIPVYFAIVKPKLSKDTSSSNSSPGSSGSSGKPSQPGSPTKNAIVTGGDGSKVTTENGTTFIYSNTFGGYWYWDENDPFNNGARAQSWNPALNETFKYGIDKIRGVNLGGWLNTEPSHPSFQFISPALFEQYLTQNPPAVDEWTLSEAMRADTANGGINQLETHYETFITEEDFAQIAAAGLNFVRIPLGYWAIETRAGEPFLANVSWKYFLKAIQWARKYGIRINLDLHSLPGSQNGWNHSGRLGTINFLQGPMGYANAQRSLDYIRILAEFISQPEYSNVVAIFGIVNEPRANVFGYDALSSFYSEAYNIIRTASGIGEGNGPFISFHDGFLARSQWVNFIPNGDRMALDTHPYICFNGQSDAAMSTYVTTPCTTWASAVNDSMTAFGLTTAGEWSNAVTDCGLWLNGVNLGTRYEGTFQDGSTWPKIGSCDTWTNYKAYTDDTKTAMRQFALATMDALQDYFFWTWKIGASSQSGDIESPAWSYQLGLQQGWMPTDPRDAIGVCGGADPFVPPLQSWQTGGAGAGNAAAPIAWPPASITSGGAVTLLPSYTQAGPIPTLSGPSFAATPSANAGNGWANAADTALMYVPIPTCSYLDPWVGDASPPSPLCGGAARRDIDEPAITPAP
ncbi:glycoside hydrolase [Pluteus cervinus]|uniref:Glycoside hydrolase n=1 Tax=Pluteus cervinus TaxID=181527 RepID=A0ACD3BFY4_9AGAR|nr:glycoside hydrolase [Pluteus cervinus]